MKKTLLCCSVALFATTAANAQLIPNAGFETWSNPNGYNMPDGWGNLNAMTSASDIYTCTKGPPGNPGSSNIKLTSKAVPGMGVMPGIAVSGVLDANTLKPVSGFAYSQRPTAITGNYQYMGNTANDVGYIYAYLTKWNAAMSMRDTIGIAMQNLTDMVMDWDDFSIPFTYSKTDNPDSCIIILSASGANPEANSFLNVDNLNFNGVTTSVRNIEIAGTFGIYPNPTTNALTADLSGLKSTAENMILSDLQGRTIWSKALNGNTKVTIPVSKLAPGQYFLKIQTPQGIVTQKFNKQ